MSRAVRPPRRRFESLGAYGRVVRRRGIVEFFDFVEGFFLKCFCRHSAFADLETWILGTQIGLSFGGFVLDGISRSRRASHTGLAVAGVGRRGCSCCSTCAFTGARLSNFFDGLRTVRMGLGGILTTEGKG